MKSFVKKMSKNILITGATSGLGRAMSKWFSNHGHVVFGCGRTVDKISDLNGELKGSVFSVVDVTNAEAVKRWSQEIESFGAPDLLINNVGILGTPNKLWRVPPDDFNNIIDTNLKTMHNVIHCFLPAMVKAKQGVVINMSAGYGRLSTGPKLGPYTCSKWAVEGLSKALSADLPSGLACATLDPGTVNTEMLQNYLGEQALSFRHADDWAEVVCPYMLQLDQSCNGQQLKAPK